MPKNCSIPGCTSRSDKEDSRHLSFHGLPKDPSLQHQWLASIKRPITISKHTRVCSLHFSGGVKSAASPIPTLFPWNVSAVIPRSASKERLPLPLPVPKRPKLEDQLYEALDEAQGEINTRDKRIEELEQEVVSMRVEAFGLQRFAGSDSDILFYTGLPTYLILMSVFRFIEPLLSQLNYRPESESVYIRGHHRALPPVDEFFMVLLRLRLALLENDLSHRFNVSLSSVSRILTTWIIFLNQQLRPLITFPARTIIKRHMPSQFKAKYPDTRIIIDCTEIYTETPSSLPVQSAVYSRYKHHHTLKGLVGISPSGAVTYVSDLYAGSTSDKEITRHCGLLELLEPGDAVMTDKGFDIRYELMLIGVRLNIPPFAKKNTQMPARDVVSTRQIASLRIHVERAIRRIKQYRILASVMPLTVVNLSNEIWGICSALTLFHPPLVMDSSDASDI